jgi:putative aldouronate transport system substrate-binding protein
VKKWLSLLIAVILILSLAACSNSDKTVNTDENKNEGKVTIRLAMKDEGPSNPVAVKFFKELEKKLKEDENLDVHIELVEVPQGNYAEKLNLLLYSGDVPDLIYFQGGDIQISQQGLLEDLRPYIKNSKYLKNILEPYNKKRLENYPYLLWIKPLSQKTPVIRKDWFDQMQSSKELMENPTVDNYYKFFKELKEKAPGGNGKPSYAVTVAGDITELDSIFNMAFGINQTWLKKSDGTYEYAKVSQSEKEKLTFYRKLYKEGILDPQYLTKQWDTKEKAFYDGDAAVIVGTAGKIIDLYNSKMIQVGGKKAELIVLPPAKGVSQGYGAIDITKESRGIAISSQSKHKDIAFKILDYLASPKGQLLDRLGFENEHYKVENNEIVLNEKYYSEWYARFWEPTEFKSEKHLKTPLLSKSATKSLEMVNQYYLEDNNFIIPEDYVAKWDAMENLYREYATDIITGKRSIDDFDDFVKEWYKAGGEEITKYAIETLK